MTGNCIHIFLSLNASQRLTRERLYRRACWIVKEKDGLLVEITSYIDSAFLVQ